MGKCKSSGSNRNDGSLRWFQKEKAVRQKRKNSRGMTELQAKAFYRKRKAGTLNESKRKNKKSFDIGDLIF